MTLLQSVIARTKGRPAREASIGGLAACAHDRRDPRWDSMVLGGAVAHTLSLLVPYTESPSSRRGLEFAFQLARGDKNMRVHAVYVVEVDRRLPLDAELPEEFQQGERCLAEADRIAREYQATCDGDILQARDAGAAIVDEAVELGAEMIVMGVAQHAKESKELHLGKTADYVLRHAPCEVVIVRDGTQA